MRRVASIAFSLLLTIGVASGLLSCSQKTTGTFEAGKGTFLLNGEPMVVKAAEIHYPRIPEPYWEQRIESCTNKKKASSTLQAIRTSPSSVAWHKSTACTSSYVRVPMYAPNGKWAACPGGS